MHDCDTVDDLTVVVPRQIVWFNRNITPTRRPDNKAPAMTTYADFERAASWLMPGESVNIMVIDFTPDPGGGDPYVTVILNGTLTFSGPVPVTGRSTEPADIRIHLQSHWGSGVRFNDVNVERKSPPGP